MFNFTVVVNKYYTSVFQVVIQNRVNLENLEKMNVIDPITGRPQEYWLTPDEKNVRPYGICIKRCDGEEN
jgi:hypothetical protein